MRSLFTRLLTGGAAYQASSVLSAALALVTLPLYTRALSSADFGVAETLLTFIILASILLRLGLGEAFVRFYFQTAEDDRARLARTTTATVLALSTLVALLAAALAGPLSALILGFEDAGLMRIARARAVGVHEPRDRLRAAARRGAPARVPGRRRCATSC